ncbi:MAG TPA: hypothetical protein VMB26_01940 [Candidatus Binataceae bacterium]|nr:hypothetical protein [Candidatus Binataceae bacterium]
MPDTQVRLDFPTAASPTTSFVPSVNPQFPDDVQRTMAIASDLSAGNQRYDYYKGYSQRIYTLKFKFLTITDKINFESFVVTVLGNDFQLTDFLGVVHTVRFAINQYQWKFLFDQSLHYSWNVQLREAVTP